ncbi:MAG: Hint domain-containing protein [Maritimibacter sp.]|nr:Hint domain-containing protein [Maritimibacter sp.]
MTLTIYAIDSQFAAATGSNVNSGAGTSTFDYPPSSTHSLIIQSLPGDTTPYLFSPGDTYTLTFSGQGGDTITAATVIRSDYINVGGDEGYAIVFEGVDSDGDLTHLVWTPEFDLESWYFNNFDAGNSPGFYNTDTNASTTYQAVCFEASMRVEVPGGMRAVAALRPGDLVTTYDGGAQALQFVAARRVRGWGRHAPVEFAPGLVGNTRALVVSQQHRILVSVPEKAETYGAPQVLVPAVAFVDGEGVRVRPRDWITYVHLLFEGHELVNCEGVACESLYLGAMAQRVLGAVDGPGHDERMAGEAEAFLDLFAARAGQRPARPFLTMREGVSLLRALSGRPARQGAMLLGPGQKNARPYRLDPGRGLGGPGGAGLPAFASLVEA